METWSRSADGSMRAEEHRSAAGPGGRIADGERHALAVRQSLRWAERAAREGDYERALGWLRMVEQVDGALDAEWRARRETWLAAWRARTTQRPLPGRGSPYP
ncbi:MAG TPA: hypothetical protein VFU94_07400 [Conexibacter sp.]|nr:hypothetical protein [Conexibacter sp.]